MKDSQEYQELKEALIDVGAFIKKGRNNLSQSSPQEIVDVYIPDSTSELEAIIKGTEKASNDIMDSCDAIERAVASLEGDAKDAVLKETAKVFAACGFQDITSQRVTKVISYLGQVESKTIVLIKGLKNFFDKEGTLPEEYQKSKTQEDINYDEIKDEDLMNGPQLDGEGLSQEEVDAMLNDF